jgi:hypothetical protein
VTAIDALKVAASVTLLLIATGTALDYFLIYGKRQSALHAAACEAWVRFDDTPIEALYLLMAHWPARLWSRLTKGDTSRAKFYGCLFSFALTALAAALAPFQEQRGDPNRWLQVYYSAVQIPIGKLLLNLPGDFLSVLFTNYVMQRLSLLYNSGIQVAARVAPPNSSSTHRFAVLLLGTNVLVAAGGAFLSFCLLGIDHALAMGFISSVRTDLGVGYWERCFASLKEWFGNLPYMRPDTLDFSLTTFMPLATYVSFLAGLIAAKPILNALKRLGLSLADRILTDADGGQHEKKFQPFKSMSYVLSVFVAALSLLAIVLQALSGGAAH